MNDSVEPTIPNSNINIGLLTPSFAKTPQNAEARPRNNVTGGFACYLFQTHFEFWRGTGSNLAVPVRYADELVK